jgi:quercetin dioxygenase-like cupin family protein
VGGEEKSPFIIMTQIRTFNLLEADALEVTETPFGRVGRLHTGEGIEAVWVSKQDEAVDPDWFSQPMVDLIVVLQGQLRVEFEAPDQADRVLDPGDLLVLPADTRCRAYRWPRDRQEATVFLAVYPKD